MLDQSSPAPELMVRMMDCMAVDWMMAARIDGGLGTRRAPNASSALMSWNAGAG